MGNNRFETNGTGRLKPNSARRAHDVQRQIGEMMLKLGMTPHTDGYAMLCDGTRLLAGVDRGRYVHMYTELYPLLEENFGRSDKVLYAMRDTIQLAWQRNDEARAELFFDDTPPCNAELLYMLAEHLKTACAKG